MGKLSQTEIEEYFKVHLPYRIRILNAHKKIVDLGAYNGDQAILDACFEASLLTGRMYLNVLGLTTKNGNLYKKDFRTTDVSAIDLGGELIDINSLSQNDKNNFVNFLIMADKGAAHLTLPRKHEWEKTHEVIQRILYFIKKNIYDRTNRKL